MKTTSKLAAILVLAVTTVVPAFAEHNATHREQQRAGRASTETMSARDERGNVVWSTVSAPFRFIGRSGMTVLRTPVILSETYSGERRMMSKRGFFARNEAAEPAANDRPGSSIPEGRGSRRVLFSD